MTEPHQDAASILTRDGMDASPNEPQTVLVAGASGGIGAALCVQLVQQFPTIRLIRLARQPESLAELSVETLDLAFDLDCEDSLTALAEAIPDSWSPDWLLLATGWLHNETFMPEKSWRQLDQAHLMQALQRNTIGPVLLLQQLFHQHAAKQPLKVGVLSARVGSISDNRLGGWHAYRASKAALNMLLKNFAIEFNRQRRPWIIVGLQPGTTATALSAPFQRNVPADQLQTPEYTASQLIKVMQALQPVDSGELFDFLGLRFAP